MLVYGSVYMCPITKISEPRWNMTSIILDLFIFALDLDPLPYNRAIVI